MKSNDPINIVYSSNFGITSSLISINTVVVVDQTKVCKRRICFTRKLEFDINATLYFFYNRLIMSSKGEVVNLSKEKYLMSFVCCLVDTAIMDCSLEVKFFGT